MNHPKDLQVLPKKSLSNSKKFSVDSSFTLLIENNSKQCRRPSILLLNTATLETVSQVTPIEISTNNLRTGGRQEEQTAVAAIREAAGPDAKISTVASDKYPIVLTVRTGDGQVLWQASQKSTFFMV